MNITFGADALLALIGLVVVVVVVIVMTIRGMNKRLKKAEAFIRGLIAHSKNVPAPTDPELYRAWLGRYNELKDSPKKTAYLNRLIEVGVLDKEGVVIREP
jgi:hypothetical protein